MRKISKRRSTAGNCLVKLPKCSGRGHYEEHRREEVGTPEVSPLRDKMKTREKRTYGKRPMTARREELRYEFTGMYLSIRTDCLAFHPRGVKK